MPGVMQVPGHPQIFQYYSETPQATIPYIEYLRVQPLSYVPLYAFHNQQPHYSSIKNSGNNSKYIHIQVFGNAMPTTYVSIYTPITNILYGLNSMPSIKTSQHFDKGEKKTGKWSRESDTNEKRSRLSNEEICRVKPESTDLKNVMDKEVNKENSPSRTKKARGSVRRSKNKRLANQVDTNLTALMEGTNEDIFYSLLIEFTVSPQELFIYGYPEITADKNVRFLKMPFGTTEPTKRKHSESDHSDSDELSLSEVIERVCARCSTYFLVTKSEYLTKESCKYHWGRIVQSQYTCCTGTPGSSGCTLSPCHVWNGTVAGVNDALEGFKKTRKSRKNNKKVFALDCEMCYTVKGLELSRVALLGYDGKIVYDHFVRPEREVVDYNTRFSGVTDADVNGPNAKNFEEVQNDILNFVKDDTILVGHALDNDLRVLKLLHYKVIDTALLFPHDRGYPFKHSLKFLMATFLRKEIQSSSSGHNPHEDALSCLELVHYKLHTKYGSSYLNMIRRSR